VVIVFIYCKIYKICNQVLPIFVTIDTPTPSVGGLAQPVTKPIANAGVYCDATRFLFRVSALPLSAKRKQILVLVVCGEF